jgi:hypothetical protein
MYEVMIIVPALPGERSIDGRVYVTVVRTRSKRRALRAAGYLNRLAPVLLSWPDCSWEEYAVGKFSLLCN